ncbi:MAG: hypothetical protein DWQ02_09710 [Bacteroidetes bacterium]|nr:MAG: hypothetical protein DWQ02_09710 [Bacteroidota bacterium]
METSSLLKAFQNRNVSEIKKILTSDSFQESSFAPLEAHLKEELAELKKKLKATVINPDGEEGKSFKGMLYLQQHFDQRCLNALPDHFAGIRDEVAFEVAQAGRDLPEGYVSLASGLLKYAGNLKLSNENLQSQINLLLKKKEDDRKWKRTLENEAAGRKTVRNYFIIGLVILGLILLGVWGFKAYQNWQNDGEVTEEQTESTSTQSTYTRKKAEDTNEQWFENERLLAASFVFGNEKTEEIRNRGNVTAELHELGFRFGNDPIQCYQSVAFDCKRPAKSITVHGDKKHDAILFLLWANKVGRQVYIEKNTSYYVFLNTHEDVYAAVIFGKNWDESLENPCGGNGFFSEDVIYAPPTSNATIPKNFDSSESRIKMRLRHEKLLPQQKVNKDRWLYIMTDYD